MYAISCRSDDDISVLLLELIYLFCLFVCLDFTDSFYDVHYLWHFRLSPVYQIDHERNKEADKDHKKPKIIVPVVDYNGIMLDNSADLVEFAIFALQAGLWETDGVWTSRWKLALYSLIF